MNKSKYNLITDINDDYNIIFNRLTRDYILYFKSKEDKIKNVLDKLDKNSFDKEEYHILLKMIRTGIVIDNQESEVKKLSYMINKSKYQDRKLLLVISPTMDCNFRCPYCVEERKNTYMTDKVEENIIHFIEKMSKQVASIQVSWFGGEPTIVIDRINRINKKIKEICDKNSCEYSITMTSNGYLLSDEVLDDLKKYNVKRIQITVDGDEEHHNKRRMLADGRGTFDTIVKNLLNAVDKGINILLRINVSDENIDSVNTLLDEIPFEKRDKLNIQFSNLFQNEQQPLPLYGLYKQAIDKGYRFKYFFKQLQLCEASFSNSFTIQPNGEIGPCQIGFDSNIKFGQLSDNGEIKITNKDDYYEFRQLSPINDKECLDCGNLPVCLGGCNVARYHGKKKCYKENDAGIDINDLIRLEIYSNIKNNLIDKENVI